MGDLRESGEITVQVRKRFSHPVELIEIIAIPWQSWSSAMGGDDIYAALERQTQSFDALEIPAVSGQRELAAGMRQKRELQQGHAFPERFVSVAVTIDGLDARQEFQKNGAGVGATLQFG